MKRFVLLLTTLVLFWTASITLRAQNRPVLVHAGRVLTVPGEAPLENSTLVIQDGSVQRILEGFVSPGEAGLQDPEVTVISLKESFVLPGLIDSHVHLTSQLGPGSRFEGFLMEDSEVTLRAAMFARRTLEAGFTTVRDAGGDPRIMKGLRDGIAKGYIPGPGIVVAGPVLITGGHGDGGGFRSDLMDLFQSETVCNGPFECREAVRKAVKLGADWIKIAATGGVLTDSDTGTDQQMMNDEIAAVVETAHMMGRKVAAHAHGSGGIHAALRAGVTSIEHGTFLDDESVEMFLENGAFYVPTMLAGKTVAEIARTTEIFPPNIKAKALRIGPQIDQAVARAHRAGVRIAFGTDSAVSKHGENAREFELLVEAGMSPMEAIHAATVNSAELLGLSEMIGTLQPGKAADLIALEGNPLEDISLLQKVHFVMKEGKVVKQSVPQ